MWIEAQFKMLTPAIIKPYIPLDGALSFSYAQLTNFKFRKKKGYIYDNLPVAEFGYVDELPIKRTIYGENKWFYNISGMVFFREEGMPEDSMKLDAFIIRKYIEDGDLWLKRFPNIRQIKWRYAEKSAKGKEKAYKFKVQSIFYPMFSVFIEVEDLDTMLKILENMKTIGKKVNQGYGRVEFIGWEEANVESYKINGILIRPVPKGLIPDDDYLEIEMKLFTPYYVKNLKYTDVCFVDRKIVEGNPIERQKKELIPVV